MSKSDTKKALENLKQRVNNTKNNLMWLKSNTAEDAYQETIKCTNEIDILIQGYERQIELNRKMNLKIKHQKGILKVLQQKQGDRKWKS